MILIKAIPHHHKTKDKTDVKNQTVVSCYSAGLLLTHVSTRPSTAADKGLGGFGATLGGFKLGEKVGYKVHRMGTT